MPFRVSGKKSTSAMPCASGSAIGSPKRRRSISTAVIPAMSRWQGRLRLSHRMRDPSRLRRHAASRRNRARCLCQRRSGGMRIEKRLRRYIAASRISRAERGDETSIDARATSSPRPKTRKKPRRRIHGHHRRVDHGTKAPLGQRCGDGTRHDRRAGCCLSTCRARRINIVYRRADGHFGWIDPPARWR